MVKKLINLIHKEWSGVTEAAFLIAGFAFVSQLLALVRDRSLAHMLGPGPTLDVYYASFRLPDLLTYSVSAMVSINVLIPFVLSRLGNGEKENVEKAKRFLSETFTSFVMAMAFFCLVLFIFMPYLAPLIAPGFVGEQLHFLIVTSRIMLLSPFLFGISNLFGTITQLYKKFFVYALCPVFYNLGIISGIYIFYPHFGIIGLSFGVILGAAMHALIQIPVLISHKFMPQFVSKIDMSEIKKVFMLSLPRTLGLSLNSFAILALIAMASTLRQGSISIFSFAYNLQAVPISIVGVSYSVAAFPMLASAFTLGKIKEYRNHVLTAARQIIFWSVPITCLFVVLRAQVVRVILGSGHFSWADTRLTAASLAFFALAITSQSLIVLVSRAYYAAGKTWRPLIVNIMFTLSEIGLAYGLLYIFKHSLFTQHFFESLLRVGDVAGTETLMLPLGYSVGIILNFAGLWYIFKKDFLQDEPSNLRKTFFQVTGASIIMSFVTYQVLAIMGTFFDLDSGLGIFLQGLSAGVVGIMSAIFVLMMLENQECKEVIHALRKRFWRASIMVPDQKEIL